MEDTYHREVLSSDISKGHHGKVVTAAGWVEDVRNLGGIAFIRLRDRGGIVQVVAVKKTDRELFKAITGVPRESVIAVRGEIVPSDQAKQGHELVAREFALLSEAAVPLPLGVADRIESDLDTRLDNRFLDLRRPEIAMIFRLRSALVQGIREGLLGRDFVEVSTPKIVAAATEGGTDLFQVQYFDRKAYLNQSPQLYKQMLMAGGLERVFELAPAFRAESHDTARHLNEYLSVDAEMSFATDGDAMDVLADAVRKGIEKASEVPGYAGPEPPASIERISYDQAIEAIADGGGEVQWGSDIDAEAFRILAKDRPGFYFVTGWPLSTKPFYVQPDGPSSRGFDLMKGHIEIASGAQRVHDHALLVGRMSALGLDPAGFEFYLKAFRYGMPPHAGWGMGLDRLVQVIAGADNVRECVLFPRDMKRLVP